MELVLWRLIFEKEHPLLDVLSLLFKAVWLCTTCLLTRVRDLEQPPLWYQMLLLCVSPGAALGPRGGPLRPLVGYHNLFEASQLGFSSL